MNVVQRLGSRRALILGAGVLFLGLGLAAARLMSCGCSCKAGMQVERWVLEAKLEPNAYYGSSFKDGDLYMPRAAHDEQVRFVHQWPFEDGCTWESVETLTPDGHGNYLYHYDDRPIACSEGSEASEPTPASGLVRVVPTFYE